MTKTMNELVALASCKHPTTPEGRSFLHNVYLKYVENENRPEEKRFSHHEIVDSAFPNGTPEMWLAFADLGAYDMDVSIIMGIDGHAEDRARVALGLIGDQLIGRLYAEDPRI